MSKYRIGRGENNDIVINDNSNIVSTEHAVLELLKNKYYLTDKSVNGTFVNGKKIPKEIRFPVSEKDKILFANKYLFQWEKVNKVKSRNIPFEVSKKLRKQLLIIVAIIIFGIITIPMVTKNNIFKHDTNSLYEKYNSGVVLIYHSFYYTIEIDNSIAVYIGKNNDGEFDYSSDDSKLNPIGIEGTGFYIDENGKIITNRHVAFPWTSSKNESEFKVTNPDLFKVYNYLMTDINKYLNRNNKGHLKRNLSGKTVYIGVANNDSFVKSLEDFNECTSIKQHQDHEIDLAIIQTNNKTLPDNSTFININNISNKVKVGEIAIIIGYPGGSNFQTKTSNATNLKVITNEGPITQKPGEKKVMYQVPTTHGASGSPVFNDKGELIAVNFSGHSTQGFNYGILSKYIKDLLD